MCVCVCMYVCAYGLLLNDAFYSPGVHAYVLCACGVGTHVWMWMREVSCARGGQRTTLGSASPALGLERQF